MMIVLYRIHEMIVIVNVYREDTFKTNSLKILILVLIFTSYLLTIFNLIKFFHRLDTNFY